MYDVCECPRHGSAEEGHAEQSIVKNGHSREVSSPHTLAVQPVAVRIECSCYNMHSVSYYRKLLESSQRKYGNM